jgi:hypothetical protein
MTVLFRILTALMMVALVAAQGPAFAASACRHHGAVQHALARQSEDPRIAAAALDEERAAATIEKKGQASYASGGGWISDMLTPAPVSLRPPAGASVQRLPISLPIFRGRSTAPPLQPPIV